jgi:steroid Delta-isomerase
MIPRIYMLALGLPLMIFFGCGVSSSKQVSLMQNYDKALKETDPVNIVPLRTGSAEEKRAIAKFTEFYRVFSEQSIRKGVRDLYGSNAYFRDGFREVQGIEAIESYFIGSTQPVSECTFDIKDVAVHAGDYYFRWTMDLTLKRSPDDKLHTVGMSHVRFDPTGKITFHQDYWDTSIVYEKIPVLGSIISWIRSRI